MKIAIAMSGGVDSSVAAALLKEQRHEVIGVTMRLVPDDSRAENEAANIAKALGIPHHVIDLTHEFSERVIEGFCQEYRHGRTPNPCVMCNRYIKFGALLGRAGELGADLLATGHHARIERDENNGRYLLKKGADRQRDQSYFLCRLDQRQLSHTMFPVGHLTKNRVKQVAMELGLAAAERPESREICFIPDDDYAGFLDKNYPGASQPGPILDKQGKLLGEHRGLGYYTVGQRRGLGMASAVPLYVIAIDAEKNAIIVGSKEDTYGTELEASDMNWIAIARPESTIRVKASIRYRHAEAEATVSPQENGNVYVKFTEAQSAIAPGQTVVFYEGDTVIGGGTIT